jgi:hypothetical protein
MATGRRYWTKIPNPPAKLARVVLDEIAMRANRSLTGLYIDGDEYRLIRRGESPRDDLTMQKRHVGDFGARSTRAEILEAIAKHRAGGK